MTARANGYSVSVCAWGTTAAVAAAVPALASGELAILTDTISGSTVSIAVGYMGSMYTVGGGFTNPMTTAGDTLYENATPAPARLPIGTPGQVYTVSASNLPSWSNTIGAATDVILTDSGTSAPGVVLGIGHNSTGTPVPGFGPRTAWAAADSTTPNVSMLFLDCTWVVATHGSTTARALWYVWDTSAREVMRFEASGSAAMIGFLGSAAVVQQTGDVGTALVTFGLMSGTPTFAAANLTGTVAWSIIAAISTLTGAYPALGDTIPEYNAAAAANRAVTLRYVAGVANPGLCGLRLSYSSTLPVTTADFSSQQILYWDPCVSDRCSMYDAVNGAWVTVALGATPLQLPLIQTLTLTYTTSSTHITVSGGTTVQLAEGMTIQNTDFGTHFTITSILDATHFTLGLAPTGTSNSGSTLAITLPNGALADVYVVYNAGSPRLQFGNLWTNSTTRADTIGYQDGVLVNTVAINSGDSNGIAAKAGRYLGTIAGTATGGEDSKTNRLCWNMYNQQSRPMVVNTNFTTNLTTSTTWQPYGGGTYKISFVIGGLGGTKISASAVGMPFNGSNNDNGFVGIGLDRTNANDAQTTTGGGTVAFVSGVTTYDGFPGIGQHYCQMLQVTNSGVGVTFYGDTSIPDIQTAIRGEIWG